MKQDIYTKGIDSSSYYYLINYSLEIDEHWALFWKVNSPVCQKAKQKFQQESLPWQNLTSPLLAYLDLLVPKVQLTKQEARRFYNPGVLKYVGENFSLEKSQRYEKGVVVPMYNK